MSDLYQSGYCPPAVSPSWERISVSCEGDGQAGDILRRSHVPSEWGNPVAAVGFFNQAGRLRAMVADYANGRRVELTIKSKRDGHTYWQSRFGRWKDAL